MSRIPHILARITQRSAPALPSQLLRQYPRAFSTNHATSQEHNLSSPSRPQPTSSAPTPATHPSYFPISARGAPPHHSSGSGSGSKNFYRTHGRALFKALTLAFFTYQVLYWGWLSLETEEIKDGVRREIRGLEGEVRLLDEGRRENGHGEVMRRVVGGQRGGERILEERKR